MRKKRRSSAERTLRARRHDEKREWLVAQIRAWAELHDGEPPRVNDWRHVTGTTWPSYLTVIRYFETWDNAITTAGFSPRGRGRPVRAR